MKKIDPQEMSLKRLKTYNQYYKELVESCRASLGEYEMFVSCQRELLLRESTKVWSIGRLDKKVITMRRFS